MASFGVNITDEHFVNYLLAKQGTGRYVVPIKNCPLELPTKEKLTFAENCPVYKHIQSLAWNKKLSEWRR